MPTLPHWPYPTHIAHRGGGRFAPENTLAAMRAGVWHGFKMVEFDVKISKDNVIYLLHDDTLNRTTNGSGLAHTQIYADLVRLDAGSWHSREYAGEPIANFTAVARYAITHNIACNIEIKPSPGYAEQTGNLVALATRDYWQNSTTLPLLSSFSEPALAAAQRSAPEVPRALLVETIPLDWRKRLAKYECIALNINHRDATPELITEVHNAGYRIAAWTVNDPERAALLLSWGIDGIITDELVSIPPTA